VKGKDDSERGGDVSVSVGTSLAANNTTSILYKLVKGENNSIVATAVNCQPSAGTQWEFFKL
jgi:hypothetical protein